MFRISHPRHVTSKLNNTTCRTVVFCKVVRNAKKLCCSRALSHDDLCCCLCLNRMSDLWHSEQQRFCTTLKSDVVNFTAAAFVIGLCMAEEVDKYLMKIQHQHRHLYPHTSTSIRVCYSPLHYTTTT